MERHPLDDAALADALGNLPEWTHEDDTIARTFRRKNWLDAIAFVNALADEAERRNHHPDVCVTGYRTVTIRLTSHDAGGITERDLSLAAWIEDLAGA